MDFLFIDSIDCLKPSDQTVKLLYYYVYNIASYVAS